MGKILKNKKILIALGAVLVIFVLIIIVFSFSYNQENQKENVVSSQNPSVPTATAGTAVPVSAYPTYPNPPTLSDIFIPPPPPDWVTGDNPLYTVKFPSSWKPNVMNITGGGISAALSPHKNSYFPRIDIETAPADPNNPIEKRIEHLKEFTPFNYSEIKTNFQGVPGVQISEILPIGDMDKNPLNKHYVFFNKGDTTFVITLAYFQDEKGDENKQLLLQVLNSIKLK